MKTYKTTFGSYIRADDLQGRDLVVDVESVTLEYLDSDGKRERKLIARFRGIEKRLILNRTNAESMANAFCNEHYDQWQGPVVLYPATTTYAGKSVPCIRVKAFTQEAREDARALEGEKPKR